MRSGYCEEVKRDKVVKIARLSGCKNFVREKFIFDAFVDFKPVERFENESVSYVIYRTAPFSITLNDPYIQFQGRTIL